MSLTHYAKYPAIILLLNSINSVCSVYLAAVAATQSPSHMVYYGSPMRASPPIPHPDPFHWSHGAGYPGNNPDLVQA